MMFARKIVDWLINRTFNSPYVVSDISNTCNFEQIITECTDGDLIDVRVYAFENSIFDFMATGYVHGVYEINYCHACDDIYTDVNIDVRGLSAFRQMVSDKLREGRHVRVVAAKQHIHRLYRVISAFARENGYNCPEPYEYNGKYRFMVGDDFSVLFGFPPINRK